MFFFSSFLLDLCFTSQLSTVDKAGPSWSRVNLSDKTQDPPSFPVRDVSLLLVLRLLCGAITRLCVGINVMRLL